MTNFSTPVNVTHSAYCIAMQPICDKSLKQIGSELLYRASNTSIRANVTDADQATARVFSIAFLENDAKLICSNQLLFINLTREWILNTDLLPPDQRNIVLEVLEDITVDDTVIHSLRLLKEKGYQIALDDYVITAENKQLLTIADIVKVDVLNGLPDTEVLNYYQSFPIQLLAEKVESLEVFEACITSGFTLFQGYFYAKPSIKESSFERHCGNSAAQLQIINALNAPEPDFNRLEKLLVQDPQLCFRLLKICNSSCFRRPVPISSIRQAMNMLGLKRLRNLTLVMLLAQAEPAKLLLLPQALIRASLCEQLALQTKACSPESAFFAGMLSMLNVIIGVSMEDIKQHIELSDEIIEALFNHAGPLGKILQTVIDYEDSQVSTSVAKHINQLNNNYIKCLIWANTLMQDVA